MGLAIYSSRRNGGDSQRRNRNEYAYSELYFDRIAAAKNRAEALGVVSSCEKIPRVLAICELLVSVQKVRGGRCLSRVQAKFLIRDFARDAHSVPLRIQEEEDLQTIEVQASDSRWVCLVSCDPGVGALNKRELIALERTLTDGFPRDISGSVRDLSDLGISLEPTFSLAVVKEALSAAHLTAE